MGIQLDDHGQPLSGFLNQKRRTERDLSELLGVAKGMLSDGVVNDIEASYLKAWGDNHPDAIMQWPTSLIFSRLQQFFADGRIDETERRELHELLGGLIGGTESLVLGYEGASTLPFDKPAPIIEYRATNIFVFTGKFAYGTRSDCERQVVERGSHCGASVTKQTSYLVIGTFGSEDWAHTSYGRKIQKAVDFRDKGVPIRIVGEDHWTGALEVA